MIVRGRSLNLLNGVLRPKSASNAPTLNNVITGGRFCWHSMVKRWVFSVERTCTTAVRDAYVFESDIAYNDCGTKKQSDDMASYYSNTLFLKDASSELVTIRDKLVQVKIMTIKCSKVIYRLYAKLCVSILLTCSTVWTLMAMARGTNCKEKNSLKVIHETFFRPPDSEVPELIVARNRLAQNAADQPLLLPTNTVTKASKARFALEVNLEFTLHLIVIFRSSTRMNCQQTKLWREMLPTLSLEQRQWALWRAIRSLARRRYTFASLILWLRMTKAMLLYDFSMKTGTKIQYCFLD